MAALSGFTHGFRHDCEPTYWPTGQRQLARAPPVIVTRDTAHPFRRFRKGFTSAAEQVTGSLDRVPRQERASDGASRLSREEADLSRQPVRLSMDLRVQEERLGVGPRDGGHVILPVGGH